jgi:hypothetical protein
MGRQNHYVGALWFYELVDSGNAYASATVTFSGAPVADYFVTVTLGTVGLTAVTALTKLIHVGDTADTIATVFALELNNGYTGVWASASGSVLTIYARLIGTAGESTTLAASTTSSGFTAAASATALGGAADGQWLTDLTASPRLNRAVRDWSLSFFTALQRIRNRYGGIVQHGNRERRSIGDCGDRAGWTGRRSDPAADAVAADQLFSYEPRVLGGSLCGDRRNPVLGRADSVPAIRRGAVVVFSE